jgi:hypothetical protein
MPRYLVRTSTTLDCKRKKCALHRASRSRSRSRSLGCTAPIPSPVTSLVWIQGRALQTVDPWD